MVCCIVDATTHEDFAALKLSAPRELLLDGSGVLICTLIRDKTRS
jgi:hypothetical protein